MHTGDLKVDSPALAGVLTRRFTVAEQEKLSEIYRLVAQLGGCTETFERTPGITFNPRPARIARLVVDSSDVPTARDTGAAMLVTLDSPTPIDANINHFESEAELARTAKALLKRCDSKEISLPEAIDIPCMRIALASMLDSVRHIHMQQCSALESDSQLLQADALLTHTQRITTLKRPHALLTHAVAQQRARGAIIIEDPA